MMMRSWYIPKGSTVILNCDIIIFLAIAQHHNSGIGNCGHTSHLDGYWTGDTNHTSVSETRFKTFLIIQGMWTQTGNFTSSDCCCTMLQSCLSKWRYHVSHTLFNIQYMSLDIHAWKVQRTGFFRCTTVNSSFLLLLLTSISASFDEGPSYYSSNTVNKMTKITAATALLTSLFLFPTTPSETTWERPSSTPGTPKMSNRHKNSLPAGKLSITSTCSGFGVGVGRWGFSWSSTVAQSSRSGTPNTYLLWLILSVAWSSELRPPLSFFWPGSEERLFTPPLLSSLLWTTT